LPEPNTERKNLSALCNRGDASVKFLFDIGSGSVSNIGSLEITFDYLDKVFVSHLHADHVGDLASLWVGGWVGGRHGALRVWGPSGQSPELGTKHFAEKLKEAYRWDDVGRLGVIPSGGGRLDVHELN
jgi:ribonuclease Z